MNETQPFVVEPDPTFSEDDSDNEEDERFDEDYDDGSSRQKIEVESLFIFREKSYESSEQECENMKVQLKSTVEKIAPNAR